MKLRVLHIAHIVGLAGAEKRIVRTLSRLLAAGVDVRLLMLYKPHKPVPEFNDSLTQAGVPVIQLPVPHTESLLNPHAPTLLREISRVISAQKPDIVQTHQIYSNFYGTIAARFAGTGKVIATRTNLGDFYRRPYWQVANWLLWKFRTAGIANSDTVRRYVERYEHVALDKVRTIYNAYEIPPDDGRAERRRQAFRRALNIPPEAPVVGSVSRFVRVKALPTGLDAFAQVHSQLPDAHYVLAGDGELREQLEAQTHQLGLVDSVHFLGWAQDINSVYDGIDVLLHPSVGEGFGNVMPEAMIHRLPIVGADAGALPEVIADGETGLLVPPNDAAAFAGALLRFLTEIDLAQQYGEAGRRRVKSVFSVEEHVVRYLRLYAEVMGRDLS